MPTKVMALTRASLSLTRFMCHRFKGSLYFTEAVTHPKLLSQRGHTRACHSASDAADREEIIEKLATCPGGSVDLSKCQETGIAVVTFNNPKMKNALSGKMVLDLIDVIGELETWEAGKGLLIRGAGSYWSSGADFKTVLEIANPGSGAQFTVLMHEIMQRMRRLPLISVCIIQGNALGGGAELTLAADFRIVTNSSGLAFIHSKMKVTPGFGGGTLLTRLVGRTKALEILASARRIGPEEALKLGLADKVVPDTADVIDFGKKWLSDLTQGPVDVVRAVKSIVQEASELTLHESLEQERRVFGTLWGSDSHREMLGKMMKKEK